MNYIVPEYYKNFECKCGECLHSCCDGWPIRISKKEYYRLLGSQCSDELRAKLDCALKVYLDPGKEDYAQISTDWRGLCKLHGEDGLCVLQAELGEKSLPNVCRLYPRNTNRLLGINKASLSNSCERVIEQLMDLKEPMQFEEIDLSLSPEFDVDLTPEKYKLCTEAISMIQNRLLPLPERFIALGNSLYGSGDYFEQPRDLTLAYQILCELVKYFEDSISISGYSKDAQRYFGIEGRELFTSEYISLIADKHRSASEHLEAILPDWQILLEQLMINHMFYNNFPFIYDQVNAYDAFLTLAITYSFLRFHLLGYMSDKTDTAKPVDFLAAMFRLVEHSNFKSNAVDIVKAVKYRTQDYLSQLLYI